MKNLIKAKLGKYCLTHGNKSLGHMLYVLVGSTERGEIQPLNGRVASNRRSRLVPVRHLLRLAQLEVISSV
jgi:hypothetical protein